MKRFGERNENHWGLFYRPWRIILHIIQWWSNWILLNFHSINEIEVLFSIRYANWTVPGFTQGIGNLDCQNFAANGDARFLWHVILRISCDNKSAYQRQDCSTFNAPEDLRWMRLQGHQKMKNEVFLHHKTPSVYETKFGHKFVPEQATKMMANVTWNPVYSVTKHLRNEKMSEVRSLRGN